jgi:hypothetical protein
VLQSVSLRDRCLSLLLLGVIGLGNCIKGLCPDDQIEASLAFIMVFFEIFDILPVLFEDSDAFGVRELTSD